MKKKTEKKLTTNESEKKIQALKKDLFNLRFKKVNNQINCETLEFWRNS